MQGGLFRKKEGGRIENIKIIGREDTRRRMGGEMSI